MELSKIAVFCGASVGFRNMYAITARDLGSYMATNNITLVYGGGKVGVMGAIADAVLKGKGEVIGVIPDLLKKEEVIHTEISKVIDTQTMSERKVAMSKMVDAYIALPGGIGTLDEFFEVLTLQQLQIEQKPVGLLNVGGFFDLLIKQLDHMIEEGFLKPQSKELLVIDATVEGLMKKLASFVSPVKSDIINKVVR